MENNEFDFENVDLQEMQAQTGALPSMPETQPEYNENVYDNASSENQTAAYSEDNNGNVQNFDDTIDWGSLQPVDEDGYRNPQEPDFDSLQPYDVTDKPASIWDEMSVKYDMGNLTQYRAGLARDVMRGKLTVEEASGMTAGRHQEILNKYGITKTPEFSFAKFKQQPLRTVFGEAVQMLPFYWAGTKKGLAASTVTVPIAIGKNTGIGAAAGSIVPGAGNTAGAGAGVVTGLIEGINNGMLIGTFLESMEVEGGNLYLDMREKGIDHNTAMATSLAGGLLDGLLETASFGVVTAPIKGAAKKAAAKMLWDSVKKSPAMQKTVKSVLTKCVTEYFKRVGMETTTEMVQDVVNNTMTLLAAQASSVDSAKPTAEDWKNIVTQTGPQTMAAMLVMSAFGTPFDVMNANIGSVKNNGGSEIGTKAEIQQNIENLAEGKVVETGGQVLQGSITMYDSSGGVAFDTTAEADMITELETSLTESQENIEEYTKTLSQLEKKQNLTTEETEYVQRLKESIKYETDYQQLVREEIAKTSEKMSKSDDIQTRKKELTEKGKKEKLSAEELQELNNIWIEEEKAKGENDIAEKTKKARGRELDREVKNLDREIEKVNKKEDTARDNRNKIEAQQDENNKKISDLEKENKEIEKALAKTDIEADVAEMETTLKKNREQINDLKKNNKALEKQRQKLNKEIESAILESDNLAQQRNVLNDERSKLSEGILNENGKIDMTAGGYKNAQLSALKSKLKAMQEGIRRGARMTRREIRDVQNTAIGLIKNSGMSDKDKTKYLTTIRDLNSLDKFNKALPELLNKISDMEDKHNKKQLHQYIGKLLKQAKPKKGGKTPVGKFNADIQRILDNITEASKLNQDEANLRIENIFDNAGENALTDEQTEQVRILFNFSDLKNKSVSELLRAARSIRMLIEDGKIAGEFREAAKKEHKEKILKEAKESIIGEVKPTGNRKLDFKNEIKQVIRTMGKSFETWNGLMNIASMHDKNRILAKLLDVFPSKMKRISGEMTQFDKFARKAMNALNCKNERDFNTRVKQDTIIQDVGYYTDRDGNKVLLQVSKAEARKLYMEMLDPTLENTLKDSNKYTFIDEIEGKAGNSNNDVLDKLFSAHVTQDKMFSIVDKSTQQLLEEFLTEEDKALIDVQFEFYREYHKRLNNFYREKYGIDMPYNDFYSPIARQIDGSDRTGDWINQSTYQKSMTPSNFINRKSNDKPLAFLNDIAVMQQHISNSEHFMAMDAFVTDANNIFGNYEVREIIRDKYGKKFLQIIDQHLKDIMNDGVQATRPELGIISKMRNLFTSSALGGKVKIAITQLTAIGVFADAIPITDFSKGLTDFILHPVEATKILSESYFLKDRANSINMEIKDIVRSQEYQAITRYKDFRQYLYFFTQLGDKWSIIAGGWTVYKSVFDKTGDRAAAMEAFERAADKYQQSGHIDNLSAWQRGGPFAKACVMFMSDQMRQMQREIHAIRDAIIYKDSEHIKAAAKAVVIMHFILPNLVQFIMNGFAWDDEDQLKATILGPFTATAIFGQMLSMGLSEALKWWGASTDNENLKDIDAFESLDLNIFGPFNKLRENVSKILDKKYKDDITSEDLAEFWLKMGKDVVGPYTGLPIKYAADVIQKYPEYRDEGQVINQAKLLLGVSPYVIEEKGNKED